MAKCGLIFVIAYFALDLESKELLPLAQEGQIYSILPNWLRPRARMQGVETLQDKDFLEINHKRAEFLS